MSVTDSQRRQLLADLERTLGPASATAMMELLPPVGWSDVARQPLVDAQFVALRGEMAELRAELKGELGEARSGLKGEMAELRAELKGEMAELRSELKGEMAELRSELKGEMAELRSELKGEMAELRAAFRVLEGKVDGQVRRLAAINAVSVVASSMTTAGLVLAAARFA